MTDGSENTIHLRTGFSLSADQVISIQDTVDEVLDAIPARFIVVVDSSGQLITSTGDRGVVDTSVIGSLVAADLAASEEIARLSGDIQDYQMILREGEKSNLVISQAGKQIAILVCYGKTAPLGWARKIIQNATKKIATIVVTQQTTKDSDSQLTLSGLPDLYSDALDEIWKD